jgi:translation initiation factor 2 beta subunit (eIF-2beta)/eIF-5
MSSKSSFMVNMDGSQDLGYRYTMPQVELKQDSKRSKTFSNLSCISQWIGRSCELIMAYITHEVSALGASLGHRNKKHSSSGISIPCCIDHKMLQQAVFEFIQKYVMCPVCRNPETRIISLQDFCTVLECSACGRTAPSSHKSSPSFFRWMQDHPQHLSAVGRLGADSLRKQSDTLFHLGTILSQDESEWSFPDSHDVVSSDDWVY